MMEALLAAPAAAAIVREPLMTPAVTLAGPGGHRQSVALALRVQVWAYAEDVLAVWVMLACRCGARQLQASA